MTKQNERLQKVIAQSGLTSRRKAEQLILEGKVTVNQKVVTTLGTRVSNRDEIAVNGVPIVKEERVYFLFNKPREVISTVKDDKNRKTVIDFFEEVEQRIFPVGRLDYHSSGLLIMTNDGDFANLLMHPRHQIKKVYVVKIKGIPTKQDLQKLTQGIRSRNELLKAESYKIISVDRRKKTMILRITLIEGRNRQIRRMIEGLGHTVLKLSRESYGLLTLDGLQPGHYRPLTPHEVKQMRLLACKNVEKYS